MGIEEYEGAFKELVTQLRCIHERIRFIDIDTGEIYIHSQGDFQIHIPPIGATVVISDNWEGDIQKYSVKSIEYDIGFTTVWISRF